MSVPVDDDVRTPSTICPLRGCQRAISNSEFKRHRERYHYQCPFCDWTGRRKERRAHNRAEHPDIPPDRLAVTPPRSQRCPIPDCNEVVKRYERKKHNRKYHFQCDQCEWIGRETLWRTEHKPLMHPPSCHLAQTIAQVLSYCDIEEGQLPWPMPLLSKLSNYRLTTNLRLEDYYGDQSTLPLYPFFQSNTDSLPPLDDVAFNFLGALAERRKSKQRSGEYGEMWLRKKKVSTSPAGFAQWIQSLRRCDPNALERRVINIPHVSLLTDQQAEHAAASTKSFLEKSLGAVDVDCNILGDKTLGEGNITPRLTFTEIHHDSHPQISTARGWKCNDAPPKLWIIWPSSEAYKLAGHYGDTEWALQNMHGGQFLVQREAESILIPPNMPHAVAALQTCYLYGTLFTSPSAHWDLTTLQVETASGCTVDDAASRYLCGLQNRLADDRSDLAAVARHFLLHWPRDAPLFLRHQTARDELADLWAECIVRQGSCAMCEALDMPQKQLSSAVEHVRQHLGNKLGV